ncbi:VOC family protein [Gaiella sp.]|uniref:VOC family protein n=1 Tax=Gaiella sp. TaxID=2663207 RepID=UPI00326339F9
MGSVLNHVSVVAHDLETSRRFYVDELGLVPLPTPNFAFPVVWLAAGNCQIHLFERPGEPPSHAHFGLEISEFMPVYRRMKELGLLDHDTFGNAMYELPDGGIQMYVRDPAGNLVELDHPDASSIPQGEVPEYMRLADLRPQEGSARSATLWHVQ